MRILAALMLLGCLSVATAEAQEVGAYSSLTYDYDTNVAQADAQTYADYGTAYYYTATVNLDLEVTPVSGGSAYTACNLWATSDNGPAEQSCSPTISGDNNLNLYTYHELDVEYTEQDMNPDSCDDYGDCDYGDDIYGYSLLDVYGDEFPYDVSWYAPNEDTPVTDNEVLYAYGDRQLTTNGCQFPTDETSTFFWWGTNHPDLAGFYATLQGTSDYTNRQVREDDNILQGDTCWFQGSLYPPLTAPNQITINGSWVVGQLNDSDTGAYLGPASEAYGLDYVGYQDPGEVTYYRTQVGSGRYGTSQCGMVGLQSMYIDGCGGYSQYYGLPHGLVWTIQTNALQMGRDMATATKSF